MQSFIQKIEENRLGMIQNTQPVFLDFFKMKDKTFKIAFDPRN